MLYWSLKTLISEPMRFIISTLAVAMSFILVIFFSAVFEGESEKMIVYLEKMKADVWVMQKGVSNMHMTSSMLWDWKADKISQIDIVNNVSAILYLNGPVKIGGKDWFAYIIGIKPRYQNAGPWEMVQGKAIPKPGEAVIPDVIAKLTGVKIGDDITMIDRKLRIIGFSKDTFSLASSVVFVSHQDLGDLLEGRDQFSYIMVYAKPGVSTKDLIDRIKENVDKVNVLSSEDFINSDKQLAIQMGAEIIRMMTIIGTLLATLIVGFTSYSLITRKKQELAVVKALGFSNGGIYMSASLQSLVITGAGLLLTLVLSFSLLSFLPSVAPQINLSVKLYQFIPVVVITLPVSIISALVAARTVAKVDPMMVFKA